jgi:exopolyphosphatase/guanosine-5'-triphosphate,3'-diphosphate pyrophosphatase
MNLAALDLGSNSFHLLVARANPTGGLTKLTSHKEVLRLGGVVKAHGRLPAPVFQTALDAVARMTAIARAFRAERMIAAGTSALRDAENGLEFCQLASRRFDVAVRLLSGREEGEIVYRGARYGCSDLPRRVAVVDIGGGSVEGAIGEGETLTQVESLPLGFLRLSEGLAGSRGALHEQVRARVIADPRGVLARLREQQPEAWLFSGGTARALGALAGAAGRELGAAELRRLAVEVAVATPDTLASRGVDPARTETLGVGASVFGALVETLGLSRLRIARGGLREGLLLQELSDMAAAPTRPFLEAPEPPLGRELVLA